MDKQLLTITEAAEVLRLGRSTVYELVAAGTIKSVRVGTARRVTRTELMAFIARLEAESIDEAPAS